MHYNFTRSCNLLFVAILRCIPNCRLLRDVLAEMKQEAEEEGVHGQNELLQAVAFVVKNDA